MTSPIKVLIIDDEDDHIFLIANTLERSPKFEVQSASTIEEALTVMNNFTPSVILADFRLPDGDARTLIAKYAHQLPMIIMTSFGNEALAVELIKSGALDYLVKSNENFSNISWYIERSLREWNNIQHRKKAEEALQDSNEQLKAVNIELVKAIEELKKSREKAIESDRLKSAFLANMSHEIRTPMNGILGFANLLNDNKLTEEERSNYLEIINNCGNQLLVILNDLIDIAKIEANQLKIYQHEVDIPALLHELHTLFSKKINGELVFACDALSGQKSLPVFTDAVRLKQVLSNLISNAIKFTHKGSIHFGYVLKDKDLEFYVKDTGIGISRDQKELVFQRFMQADVSPTRRFGGTGLGLSISKALVELLGGEIWFESTLDAGSCFYFTIPLKPVKPE
jgi:signal transduction histidine kinase